MFIPRSVVLCLAATSIPASNGGPTVPADTYFSLAITENSHNHSGARLLFLDFQVAPFTAPDEAKGEVVSTEVAGGAVVLDGSAAEWDPTYLTAVHGLVQNNYPLSEFIDAQQTEITVGSAWDATYVYFLAQWEDGGHDASSRYKKWIFGDQGSGEIGWNQNVHVGATPGAPNESAVNALGHELFGAESEDRAFLMFPIVDTQANFAPDGAGCALYCHTNLADDWPWQNYTGDDVAAMHTNVLGDLADIWHWKSSRTEPSGFADDKYIEFAVGSENGRKSDAGTAAYSGNDLANGDPSWMHQSGLGFLGDALFDFEAVSFAGFPVQGDELPRQLSVQPSGSRGDVETAAHYDPATHVWTVEFRRQRDTGNADDHSFEGVGASPPTSTLVSTVDVGEGQSLYIQNCLVCHGPEGVGSPDADSWSVPRVQRTSGSLIAKAIATVPAMSFLTGMPDQEMEDVAAYLQTKATFDPVRVLSVDVVGATENGIVTSEPSGIECPGACTIELTEGAPVTLHAAVVPGYTFTGWSGPCSGTGDCSFTLSSDTVVTATYVADCAPQVYCVSTANSTGSASELTFTGSCAVSDNDFTLVADHAPASQFGVFAYSSGHNSFPLGDGLLCIGGGPLIYRLNPPVPALGGTFSKTVDFADPPAATGIITAGSGWSFQCWYRDPAAGGTGYNLSNAIDVAFD